MANGKYMLYPHSKNGTFLVVTPDGREKTFRTRAGAKSWVKEDKKPVKPEKVDPTKGMTQKEKSLYRLQNQPDLSDMTREDVLRDYPDKIKKWDDHHEGLLLDSANVYKQVPRYTPSYIIEKEELERQQKELKKKQTDERTKTEKETKRRRDIDPEILLEKIRTIEKKISEIEGDKRYKTLLEQLKRQKADLMKEVEDYQPYYDKPKIII